MIEWRSANGNYAQMPQLVTELIQSKSELIVVESTAAAQAVKRPTSTIPIVMVVVADPVGSRLAPSLAHSPKRTPKWGKADISDNWRAVPPGSTLSRHSTRQRRRWPDCASSRQTGLRTNRLELCGGS